MTTQSPPIVSLQAPKDVSIDVIEQELRDIWQSYNNNEDGMAATRATTFSFIVYEPDAVQELLTLLGYYTGPIAPIWMRLEWQMQSLPPIPVALLPSVPLPRPMKG